MARKKVDTEPEQYKFYMLWESASNPDGTKYWRSTIADKTVIKTSEADAFEYAREFLDENAGQILILGITQDDDRKELWTIKKHAVN